MGSLTTATRQKGSRPQVGIGDENYPTLPIRGAKPQTT